MLTMTPKKQSGVGSFFNHKPRAPTTAPNFHTLQIKQNHFFMFFQPFQLRVLPGIGRNQSYLQNNHWKLFLFYISVLGNCWGGRLGVF